MHNVTLDFTVAPSINKAQELAIMPAVLAKKLLRLMASNLTSTSLEEIVEEHVAHLRECGSVTEVLAVSEQFLNERTLIQNVIKENWAAYTVVDPEAVVS